MSGFRTPLDAYREDLSRAQGRKRLGAGDEFWIIIATGLRRLVQVPVRSRPATAHRLATALATFAKQFDSPMTPNRDSELERSPPPTGGPAAIADALSRFPRPDAASAFVTHVRGTASDAEEAGAVVLAREMLADLQELSSHAPPLDRGMILIQLGRIARSTGDLDGAQDVLATASQLAQSGDSHELEIRVAAAQAVLARTRGNYPAARKLFEKAMDGAKTLGLADVAGVAHHGLMIVTAEAGDYDAALRHGWQAWSAARDQHAREAEMLINLAELCTRTGYDAAALGALAAALARTTIPRLRLPALAGTAAAAGRLRDAARLAVAERAIVAESTDAFPFETARAWVAVARAKRALGDAGANTAAEKAAVIARAHGFFEITHRLEEHATATRASLSATGLEVIKSLERWSDQPSAELVLSTSSTD